jgi:hypothetical protein
MDEETGETLPGESLANLPATGVEPWSPMNTHDDDEVQLNELTALTPDGNFTLAQVLPLSVLDHSGAAPPVRDGPLTTHSSTFAHEIAFSADDFAGAATAVHVTPPSEVTTSLATAF